VIVERFSLLGTYSLPDIVSDPSGPVKSYPTIMLKSFSAAPNRVVLLIMLNAHTIFYFVSVRSYIAKYHQALHLIIPAFPRTSSMYRKFVLLALLVRRGVDIE
jgi:hypothetical protein